MAFHVGQRVVCIWEATPEAIASNSEPDLGTPIYPSKGQVLVIRSINDWPRKTLLCFVEIDNSAFGRGGYEPGFNALGFRPLVERKTDISIFTAMLTPSKAKDRA